MKQGSSVYVNMQNLKTLQDVIKIYESNVIFCSGKQNVLDSEDQCPPSWRPCLRIVHNELSSVLRSQIFISVDEGVVEESTESQKSHGQHHVPAVLPSQSNKVLVWGIDETTLCLQTKHYRMTPAITLLSSEILPNLCTLSRMMVISSSRSCL